MVFKPNSNAKKKQALSKIFQSLKLYAFSYLSYDKWKYININTNLNNQTHTEI